MKTGLYLYRQLILAVCLLSPCLVFSQNKIIDELQESLKNEKRDSLRSLILLELSFNYIGYDTAKCDETFQQAYRILHTSTWTYNWGYYYEIKSQISFYRGQYGQALLLADSARGFYKKVVIMSQKKQALFRNAVVTAENGNIYSMMGNYEAGIKSFLEGLRLYEASDHPETMARVAACYNNMASLYFGLHQYNKSMEYDLKAIPFHLLAGDNESISWAYIYVASDFTRIKQFDSAKNYFLKAEHHVKKLDKPSVSIEYYGKMGEMYWTLKNWEKAIEYYTIANTNAKRINDWYNQSGYLRGIADSYYFANDQLKAEAFALKALAIHERNDFPRERKTLYNLFSLIYAKNDDYKNAYIYTKKYIKENIKINDEERAKVVADLETKYMTAKKEKEIIQLQKDKEIQNLSINQKSTLNYFLVSAIGALLLVGVLVYRNFHSRHLLNKQQDELQQQRIRELEKDKLLVAIDSMLKTQEEERSRMARDLHDGLGGMLSGVKLSLGAMKGNIILSENNTKLFAKVLDQLDHSIREMRRVAHNMMPEALVKFGLQQAIQDYCDGLNESIQPHFKIQLHGLEDRLEAATEIIVYRVVQELLNNVVKHANATIVLVQVMRHENNLNITIEDNGKGFDVSNSFKGDGLNNVRSRVGYLKGQLDIQSVPGEGTSVHVDITIQDT